MIDLVKNPQRRAGKRNTSPPVPRPRSRVRRWGTLAAGAGVFGIILFAGGILPGPLADTPSVGQAPVLAVATQAARLEPGYQVPREFVGRVEPHRQSQLGLEVGGLLTTVHCDEGEIVSQGDLIARLDTQILEARRDAVAAQLSGARARLQEMLAGPRQELIDAARSDVHRWEAQKGLADITLARQQQLLERTASSQQSFDDASYGMQVVTAQLATAQARLEKLENGTRQEQIAAQQAVVRQLESEHRTIEINLSKSMLRAPFDGVVSQRFVDEGTVIAAGTPVLELMEVGQLDIRIGISKDALSALHPDREHAVIINHQSFAAMTRAVRPDRNDATRTVTVLMQLSSSDDRIHVGDLATLQLEDDVEESGFWVPVSALTESYRGLWGCYVAEPTRLTSDSNASHRLRLRELEVLYQTASRAFVRGSLRDGEQVVIDGTQRLVANQRVRLAEPTQAISEFGQEHQDSSFFIGSRQRLAGKQRSY